MEFLKEQKTVSGTKSHKTGNESIFSDKRRLEDLNELETF